jgi:hypothetical protein
MMFRSWIARFALLVVAAAAGCDSGAAHTDPAAGDPDLDAAEVLAGGIDVPLGLGFTRLAGVHLRTPQRAGLSVRR